MDAMRRAEVSAKTTIAAELAERHDALTLTSALLVRLMADGRGTEGAKSAVNAISMMLAVGPAAPEEPEP